MSLMQSSIELTRRFVTYEGGFSTAIRVERDRVVVEIRGLAYITHLALDTDGNVIASKKAHCHIIEADLVEKGLSIRGANGHIDARNLKITFTDANGTAATRLVKTAIPDETIGLVGLILGEYAR